MANSSATVYGIGVGPGDPELMTLKGARLLAACPVIAYPAPETGDSMARRIAAPHLPDGATEIIIRTPMAADRFPAQEVYGRAAAEIGEHLAAGRDVAVLCEGDPFFYGSFMHLHARLRDRIPVEIVPAITGMSAAWTATNRPITWGDDVLSVLMATLPEDVLAARMAEADALVVMKIGRNMDRVRRALRTAGKFDRAWLVECAAMEAQRVMPLVEAEGRDVPYFSIVLVHGQGRRP